MCEDTYEGLEGGAKLTRGVGRADVRRRPRWRWDGAVADVVSGWRHGALRRSVARARAIAGRKGSFV